MRLICLKLMPLLSLLTLFQPAFAEYAGPYYNIDLRDHIKFGTFNDLPTGTLQVAIENRPCYFIAPIDPSTSKPDLNYCDVNLRLSTNPNIELTREGALGPDGYSENEVFYQTDQKGWSRNDVIYSVEFDGPNSIRLISEGVYEAKIILFIHDRLRSTSPEGQYYFRKLVVQTDAAKIPIGNLERVKVIKVIKDIPLTDTHFEVFTDISDRKLILTDKINQITKVIPVGVGSFDIRTLGGMDNFVGSMTEELKNNAVITRNPPPDDSGDPTHVQIKEERNHPDYYRGRPFIGVLDNNGTKYKEIGFHYQIDNDALKRGFVSHGCIRVRDKDLYQLAVIVFKSLQTSIPVKVVNSFYLYSDLYEFSVLDHPYPKLNDGFKRIIYADQNYLSEENKAAVDPSIIGVQHSTSFSEVERFEWCRKNGKYNTIRYQGPWASVLGTDCLTRTAFDNRPVGPVLDFMNGFTTEVPMITAHEASASTTPLATQGSFDQEYMCSMSLGDGAKYYKDLTSTLISYEQYVNLCGCRKLKRELRWSNNDVGRSEYRRMCR